MEVTRQLENTELTQGNVPLATGGVLLHVLEYLKGLDVPLMGLWTEKLVGRVDDCQVCHGEEGGELGNENLINNVRVCDYCHSRMLSGLIDEPTWDGTGPTSYVTVKEEKKPELVQILPKEDENVADEQSNSRHFPEGD